jgi:hypothetical protein
MPHVNVIHRKILQPWHHCLIIPCFHPFENIMLTLYFVMLKHTIATLQTNNPFLSIAHYIPCFQNIQSEKWSHVFYIVLHMFLHGLNLNKTMGSSKLSQGGRHLEKFKIFKCCDLSLMITAKFETWQIRNEPRTN